MNLLIEYNRQNKIYWKEYINERHWLIQLRVFQPRLEQKHTSPYFLHGRNLISCWRLPHYTQSENISTLKRENKTVFSTAAVKNNVGNRTVIRQSAQTRTTAYSHLYQPTISLFLTVLGNERCRTYVSWDDAEVNKRRTSTSKREPT